MAVMELMVLIHMLDSQAGQTMTIMDHMVVIQEEDAAVTIMPTVEIIIETIMTIKCNLEEEHLAKSATTKTNGLNLYMLILFCYCYKYSKLVVFLLNVSKTTRLSRFCLFYFVFLFIFFYIPCLYIHQTSNDLIVTI